MPATRFTQPTLVGLTSVSSIGRSSALLTVLVDVSKPRAYSMTAHESRMLQPRLSAITGFTTSSPSTTSLSPQPPSSPIVKTPFSTTSESNLAPLFRTDEESSRKMWNDMGGSYDGSLFEYFTNLYATLLATRINATQKTVLDLGCGTGQVALQLADRYDGVKVDAADISEEMVTRLERKTTEAGVSEKVTPMVANAAALPAEWEGRFDLVVANLSLMFVSPEEQQTAFAEIGRVLKPGGHAYVTSWSILRDNPGIAVFYESLNEAIKAKSSRSGKEHIPLMDRPNPNFSLCAPRVLKDMMALGGLSDNRVAKFAHTYDGTVDDYLSMALRTLEATPLEGEYLRIFQQEFATRSTLRSNMRELSTMINVGIGAKE